MNKKQPTNTAAKRGNRSYLEEMFRLMWPAPNRMLSGRGRPAGGSSSVVDDFAVLPTLDKPRIVVPRASRRAAAASVGLDELASAGDRLRHHGMATVFRLGAGQRLGTRVRVMADPGDHAESITSHLRGVLGHQVHPSFRVGTPRANRKPVLRLLDDSGRTVAFAKIGISDFTSSLVRAEAVALDDLKRHHPRAFTAPEVLHHGDWRGLEVLVQTALPRSAAGSVASEDRRVAMLEIATGNEPAGELDLLSSPYWRRLRTEVAAGRDDFSQALASALGRLADRLGETRLPFGAWHGDWTPWNMAPGAGSILVWDWERYESDVPLGFDALHFHFQQIKSSLSPEAAIRDVNEQAAALLAPFGVAPPLSSTIMVLYAATLASRYARDYAAMGDRTWKFQGSRKLQPLTAFVTDWAGSS
jgi:hypothetical protein